MTGPNNNGASSRRQPSATVPMWNSGGLLQQYRQDRSSATRSEEGRNEALLLTLGESTATGVVVGRQRPRFQMIPR